MERHVTHTSRLADMEDATTTAFDKNNKALSLETKMNSADVQALNDTAQLEIYGDGGHDYTYTKMLPNDDGNPTSTEVSTKDHPFEGKISEIKANRRFGNTEAEREKAADKYLDDVQKLRDEGYELTQAKLIMDLRESDLDKMGDLAGKKIKDGENPLVAWKQARDQYGKKDDKRKQMILEEGIVSTEEYDSFRNSGTTETDGADDGNSPTPSQNGTPAFAPPVPGTQVDAMPAPDPNTRVENMPAPTQETANQEPSFEERIAHINSIVKNKIENGDDIESFAEIFQVANDLMNEEGARLGSSQEDTQKAFDQYVQKIKDKLSGEGSDDPQEPSTLDKMEAVEFTDEQNEAINNAKDAAKEAREKYEDIIIRREGRAFNFKKGFRSKDMQEAYDAWVETENHAGAVVASTYAAHGFNMDTVAYGEAGGETNPDRDSMRTLKSLGALTTIDIHTESIKAKIEESNKSIGKITKKIAEIYANFGAVTPGQNPEEESRRSKLGRFTKKAIKVAGIVGLGAGTAILASPFLSGIAAVGAAGTVAGAVVTRVARGGLIAKIKKVENARLGATRADENRLAARNLIEEGLARNPLNSSRFDNGMLAVGSNVFKENSEKVVRGNQRRLIGGVALGAAGGALVEGYGDDVWNSLKGAGGKVGDVAEGAWDKLPFTGGSVEAPDVDPENPGLGGVLDTGDGNTPGDNGVGLGDNGGNSGPEAGGELPGDGDTGVVDPGDAEGGSGDTPNPGIGEGPNGIEGQPDFTGQNPEIADGDNPGFVQNPAGAETGDTVSNSFNVEAGNGFTHEIQDLGTELGVELDGDTAYRIYNDAINQFGSDLTTGGEYSMGGNNFGLSSAGMTEWNPGVREFLEQQIANTAEQTLPSTD